MTAETTALTAQDLNFDPPCFDSSQLAAFARQHYGLDGELRALDGERDQNHCLTANDGRQFVLKVSGQHEDPGVVDFQVQALRHLERNAPVLAVPRVLPSITGNFVEPIKDASGQVHLVRLLSWLPGMTFSEGDEPGRAAFAGAARFQARLARGLRGFFHPGANHFVAWDIKRGLVLEPGVQVHVGSDAMDLSRELLQRLDSEVLPRLPSLRWQVIHGDGHSGNLLRMAPDASDVTGVIDFGDMVHAPLIQDLAVTVASFARHDDMSLDNAAAQVEAFNAIMPLEDEEIELLHELVLLRLLTALFLYDFRINATRNPPSWLQEERPEIVLALRCFLALDPTVVLSRYRAACGRSSGLNTMPAVDLLPRRQQAMGPSYRLFYDAPLHLVRGEGVYLYDAQGRQYLDCYNNVASVGHCHPHVVAALAGQAATLNTHTRYLHDTVVSYAERLTSQFPAELSVCLFVCTGTEANDLAIRIARTVTGHEGVVVSEEAYHGNSNVVAATSTCTYPVNEQPDWLATVAPPNGYRGEFRYGAADIGMRYAEQLQQACDLLDERGHGAAAFLCDTIFDSNGTLVPPPNYLEQAAARVRAAGGLFIADEVQAGFYRTGEQMWGFANSGLVPDIVTLGKPMGAGHPLAAVIIAPALAAAFAERFSYFNTFGGNPVSAAVGMAVLDVIETEELQKNVIATGAHLQAGLSDLQRRFPLIGDIRGSGLFWGLELVRDHATLEPAAAEAERLVNLMQRAGVLIGVTGPLDNVIKIRPPLVFNTMHADCLLDCLGACFEAL